MYIPRAKINSFRAESKFSSLQILFNCIEAREQSLPEIEGWSGENEIARQSRGSRTSRGLFRAAGTRVSFPLDALDAADDSPRRRLGGISSIYRSVLCRRAPLRFLPNFHRLARNGEKGEGGERKHFFDARRWARKYSAFGQMVVKRLARFSTWNFPSIERFETIFKDLERRERECNGESENTESGN